MFTVYVLYSVIHDKTYTGYTSDLPARFKAHNILATKGFTVRYRPWIILHTEIFPSKIQAMKREKELKSGKGRAFIRQIVANKNPT